MLHLRPKELPFPRLHCWFCVLLVLHNDLFFFMYTACKRCNNPRRIEERGYRSVVERRAHDRSSQVRFPAAGAEKYTIFLGVNILCRLWFWSLFHRRLTEVTCERPRLFCQKCRRRVTTKHCIGLHPWPNEVTVGWPCSLRSSLIMSA